MRSYWAGDGLYFHQWNHDSISIRFYELESSRGGLRIYSAQFQGYDASSVDPRPLVHRSFPAEYYPALQRATKIAGRFKYEQDGALGFQFVHWTKGLSMSRTSLTLPLYFPTLLFALLPAHYFLRVRHRRRAANRQAQGRCIACGYDLRASPERCPECGAACKAANPTGVSPAAEN